MHVCLCIVQCFFHSSNSCIRHSYPSYPPAHHLSPHMLPSPPPTPSPTYPNLSSSLIFYSFSSNIPSHSSFPFPFLLFSSFSLPLFSPFSSCFPPQPTYLFFRFYFLPFFSSFPLPLLSPFPTFFSYPTHFIFSSSLLSFPSPHLLPIASSFYSSVCFPILTLVPVSA